MSGRPHEDVARRSHSRSQHRTSGTTGPRTPGSRRTDRTGRSSSAPDRSAHHAALRPTVSSAVATARARRSPDDRPDARTQGFLISVRAGGHEPWVRSARRATNASSSPVGARCGRDEVSVTVSPRTGRLGRRRRACTGRQRYRPSCPNEATHPKGTILPQHGREHPWDHVDTPGTRRCDRLGSGRDESAPRRQRRSAHDTTAAGGTRFRAVAHPAARTRRATTDRTRRIRDRVAPGMSRLVWAGRPVALSPRAGLTP